MNEENLERFYSKYDTAVIDPENKTVQFESDDWFEEPIQLTPEVAHWILLTRKRVFYDVRRKIR